MPFVLRCIDTTHTHTQERKAFTDALFTFIDVDADGITKPAEWQVCEFVHTYFVIYSL